MRCQLVDKKEFYDFLWSRNVFAMILMQDQSLNF